ncbi:AraC family transcriptional regulator [Halieaceae bacterium IMCC14734]|uniref:AraC family transcriptional regulator n=1 Tax=Candidatus Litorirhabdus singularis TaxID=2518993 RepID=A0ABT3TEF5_9GAMM|nr:AraC family transcriptional regulator [Candidatus Litorirhabdus singularis]MCX2980693.1 AraC family transcriptional regulator [Candidatus Litorirhabdus singularis]
MEITTVPAHYISTMLDALAHRDCDPEVFLSKIAFPKELLQEEKARIPRSDYLRFTGYVALKLQDENLGLLKKPMKPGTFAMLCHACINCERLEHFLKRMAKYAAIANPGISLELTRGARYARLTLTPQAAEVYSEDLFVMLALAVAHRLSSWVTDQTVLIEEVSLRRKRPFYASDYNSLFNAKIKFAQQENYILFNSDYLDARIKQDEQSLCVFLQNAGIHLMSELDSDETLTAQIRNILKEKVAGEFPSFKGISSSLDCSPTTLKRRLLSEGSTYQTIKDAVRRDTAIHYLVQGSMSVDEVATRAGFSDPSSFFRAFKRWTGTSPRAYVR